MLVGMSQSEFSTVVILVFCATGIGCLHTLPPFQSHQESDLLTVSPNTLQAIVPSYQFTCPGRVSQWGGCFLPAADSVMYSITYQVWRENSPGCFRFIGSNSHTNLSTLDEPCGVTSVPHEDQIVVQVGDVVGFFFSRWTDLRGSHLLSTTDINSNTGLQIVNTEQYEIFYTSSFVTDSIAVNVAYLHNSPAAEQELYAKTCAATNPDFRVTELLQTLVGAPVITAVIGPSSVTSGTASSCHHMTTPTPLISSPPALISPSASPITGASPSSPASDSTQDAGHRRPVITATAIGGGGNPSLPLHNPTNTLSTSLNTPTTTLSISLDIPTTTLSISLDIPTTTLSISLDIPTTTLSISLDIPSTTLSKSLDIPTTSPTPSSDTSLTGVVQTAGQFHGGSGGNATHTPSPHQTYAIAGSVVVVLLTVLVVLVAILMVIVCVRRRARSNRRKHGDNLPIHSPQNTHVTGSSVTPGEGEAACPSLNRYQDRTSMISNSLYSSGRMRGPKREENTERASCDRHPQQERLRPPPDDSMSMVYNALYGTFTGNVCVEGTTRAKRDDTEDHDYDDLCM